MSVNKITQLLASVDQDDRDKALQKLQKVFREKKPLTKTDFQKLWQGIYYCYWLADRQAYQDEMGIFVASLLQELDEEYFFLYLSTFYEIMIEKYPKLDKHRVSKYLSLLRYFVQQSIVWLKNNNYNENLMKKYSELLLTSPLSLDHFLTDSIKGHLSDVLILELENFGGKQLNDDILLEFFRPFFILFSKTSSKALLKTMEEEFMEIILGYDFEQQFEGEEVILPINYPKLVKYFKELRKTKCNKNRVQEWEKKLYMAQIDNDDQDLLDIISNDMENISKGLNKQEEEEEEKEKESSKNKKRKLKDENKKNKKVKLDVPVEKEKKKKQKVEPEPIQTKHEEKKEKKEKKVKKEKKEKVEQQVEQTKKEPVKQTKKEKKKKSKKQEDKYSSPQKVKKVVQEEEEEVRKTPIRSRRKSILKKPDTPNSNGKNVKFDLKKNTTKMLTYE
eukprot:gene4241-7578_t